MRAVEGFIYNFTMAAFDMNNPQEWNFAIPKYLALNYIAVNVQGIKSSIEVNWIFHCVSGFRTSSQVSSFIKPQHVLEVFS